MRAREFVTEVAKELSKISSVQQILALNKILNG
jgi:hypothetical protein